MKTLFIFFIRIYQLAISPFTANHCRFYPTCSHYAILAIRQHGAFFGCWLALKRIARCRPGCDGGVDPVPDNLNSRCCHKS